MMGESVASEGGPPIKFELPERENRLAQPVR